MRRRQRRGQEVAAQHETYRRQLFDAELSSLARLAEANQIRDNLVASASHEFRTPLTAIRGSALTLLGRYDSVRPKDRQQLLAGIVEHADRLGRLLEDMLVAACAADVDRGGTADVTAAVHRFRDDLGDPHRTPGPHDEHGPHERTLCVEAAPDLRAYIDSVWLDQIVGALHDHLRTEARCDRPVEVRAGDQDGEVAIRVTYVPVRPPEDPARLFDAFASGESARTGRPTSLALYVARRLAEVHGGRVSGCHGDDGSVVLGVCLPAAGSEQPQRTTP